MAPVRFFALAVVVALAVVASSCGVTAETTAATVGNQVVEVDTVDTLAADQEFLEFGLGLQGAPPVGESTMPGAVARAVLLFEIQRAAWLDELERWDLELTDEVRAAGLQRLDEERELAGVEATFSDEVRAVFSELFGAQLLLEQRFASLDPTNEADTRTLYDGVESYWSRTCATIVAFEADEADAARDAIADGADIETLAPRLQTAQVVAAPEDFCPPTSSFDSTLRDSLEAAPVGTMSDVVVVEGGQLPVGYVFVVEGRERMSFADAAGELIGIVEAVMQGGPAPWINQRVSEAEINPRYGGSVTVGPGGAPTISPPELPAPAPTSVSELQVPEGLEELVPLDESPQG